MDSKVLALILEGYKRQIAAAKDKVQDNLPPEIGKHTKCGFESRFYFPALEPIDALIGDIEYDIKELKKGEKE